VPRYRMQVFVLAAAYAALAGALYAHYIRFISPSPFSLYASLFFLIMAAVGGLTNIWGGLIGATLITLLDQVIRAEVPRVFPRVGGEYQTAIYGVLLVLIMIFFPRGIVRGALDLRAAFSARAARTPGGPGGAEPVEEGRG
jgi:branched-chain amino acid transport system permease protein